MAQKPSGRNRGSRHGARRLAVQAVYQWLVSDTDVTDLVRQFTGDAGGRRADRAYFEALLRGSLASADAVRASFDRFLDRPMTQLDPVEHAILLVSGFELINCPEVPYRVVVNEGIELAKVYGASESHRYVNGILDRLASNVRTAEHQPHARR